MMVEGEMTAKVMEATVEEEGMVDVGDFEAEEAVASGAVSVVEVVMEVDGDTFEILHAVMLLYPMIPKMPRLFTRFHLICPTLLRPGVRLHHIIHFCGRKF